MQLAQEIIRDFTRFLKVTSHITKAQILSQFRMNINLSHSFAGSSFLKTFNVIGTSYISIIQHESIKNKYAFSFTLQVLRDDVKFSRRLSWKSKNKLKAEVDFSCLFCQKRQSQLQELCLHLSHTSFEHHMIRISPGLMEGRGGNGARGSLFKS